MRDWEDDGPGRITEKQRKMLNSVAGDLARSITWHGYRLDKDDWRNLLSGVSASLRVLPGWEFEDGRPAGMVVVGCSSLKLSRRQAKDAITMGVRLGDDPSTQGMDHPRVSWSDATLHGLGYTDADIKALRE